ncbi:MAG: hypothetical protein WDN09_00695 [bacterium]
MAKYNKYLRPYCSRCKSVYSLIKNIGRQTCPKCGTRFKSKSYNPYPGFFLGLMMFIVGVATLVVDVSPVIWIGGFLAGGIRMATSFDQWEKIKELDKF